MMTLDKITTPFERRRVIEYGKDGNKVVRHWYEVQHVIGTLYKTKETKNEWGDSLFNLVIFFDNKSDGLMFERMSHPERYTVERVADTMRRYQIDSVTHMYIGLNDRMEQNKFIGAADIEFFRQFDRAAAERYAQHRLDYYARKGSGGAGAPPCGGGTGGGRESPPASGTGSGQGQVFWMGGYYDPHALRQGGRCSWLSYPL